MGVTVEYSSNNSGGSWWLSDDNWYALEKAGWRVEWIKDQQSPLFRDESGRFLGALATHATKEFPTLREGIQEWETVTGQVAAELGCGCCGPPHSFSTDNGEYYSPQAPIYGEPY